jgi:hypothetical protein
MWIYYSEDAPLSSGFLTGASRRSQPVPSSQSAEDQHRERLTVTPPSRRLTDGITCSGNPSVSRCTKRRLKIHLEQLMTPWAVWTRHPSCLAARAATHSRCTDPTRDRFRCCRMSSVVPRLVSGCGVCADSRFRPPRCLPRYTHFGRPSTMAVFRKSSRSVRQ